MVIELSDWGKSRGKVQAVRFYNADILSEPVQYHGCYKSQPQIRRTML